MRRRLLQDLIYALIFQREHRVEINDMELGLFSAYHGGGDPLGLAGSDGRSLELQADSASTLEACQASRPCIGTQRKVFITSGL